MNSFAMIFGHCVWIPPSAKAAMVALSLFYGIGIGGEADVHAAELVIAEQYTFKGLSPEDARKQVDWLNSCFLSYEVPPENRTRPLTH